MFAALIEAETAAGNQILDSSRDKRLTGARKRRDARGNVDGDALHVIVGDLDLAGMEAVADLDVEWTDHLGNGASATHCPRRAVECGEKPVPKRFDLTSPVTRDFLPDCGVMSDEEVAPALVAQLFGSRGRAHDVSEENGRKDAATFCHGDGSGENSSMASPIRWRTKKRGGHPHHRHSGSGARAQSLEAPPPSLQGKIVRTGRRPKWKTEAAPPVLISVCEEGLQLFGPKRRTRKATVEHQSSASLRVGCGKRSSPRTARTLDPLIKRPKVCVQNQWLNFKPNDFHTIDGQSVLEKSQTDIRR